MPHAHDNTTVPPAIDDPAPESAPPDLVLALVIVWSALQPFRIGEVALLGEGDDWILGRGNLDEERRLRFGRQRPGSFRPLGPLIGDDLSRRQLVFECRNAGVDVRREGQAKLYVNAQLVEGARLAPGDILDIRGQLVLLCVMRPREMPEPAHGNYGSVPFGRPDAHGMLGESPAAWALRDQIVAASRSTPHVFIHGASGTGKELVARAIHALSPNARGPLVSRSAATFPPLLIDAELFGNPRGFPNPGMPERSGLVGEAHGGTLFLDEIGELPPEMQAHLLRVLDDGGEYQRLGEAQTRRSTFRLIGATNRSASAIKHDLLARLKLHIEMPGLDDRLEDIPQLVRHFVSGAATSSPEIAARFVRAEAGGPDEVSVDPTLIIALLRRSYTTNMRELEGLLWRAMHGTKSTTLVLPKELRASQPPLASTRGSRPREGDGTDEATRIIKCLDDSRWNVTKAAAVSGLSRDQMRRLMAKHGLKREPSDD